MNRFGVTALAVLFAGAFALWWTCFHSKRMETAVWLGQHQGDLAQIHDELDAHPALCKVWIGAAPDVLCDKHLTAADKDSFRKVAGLLRDVDGFDVSRDSDYRGKLDRVSIGIFGVAFISPPEYADWYADKDYPGLATCTGVGLAQWYACDGKVGFM